MTSQLRSPHTVELWDFGMASDGRFYYVMEMLDGTATHTHQMSNFTQLGTEFDSATNETTITGTSTITLPGGPMNDVGTEMTLSNGTVAIEFDPDSTDGHFGDTPIYGMIVTPEMIQEVKGMMDQRGGNMTMTAPNSTMG